MPQKATREQPRSAKASKSRPQPTSERSAAEAVAYKSGRGSKGRPTRLHVEVPFEGLRYKYTKALFFESNNWVPALPPTFYRDPP